MSNNIPKEWANKRPRNMAHATESQPLLVDKFDIPVKIGVGFAVSLVCVMILAVMLYGLGNAADRRQNAVGAAVGASVGEVSITPLAIDTNTPQPSSTPQPSRTPYPTKTAQPTQAQAVIVIETVIVERVVVETVQVIITATPQPWTASPTPNATATVAAWEFENRRSDERRANFWAWAGSVLAAGLIVGALAWYIIGMIRAAIDRSLKDASDETTAEDIRTVAAEQAQRHPLADIPADKRLHIVQLWRAGRSQRFIEETVFGYTGGTAHDIVARVIEYHAERGVLPYPAEDAPQNDATQA